MDVSIIGCVVNGPGGAGLRSRPCGRRQQSAFYRGQRVDRLDNKDLIPTLERRIRAGLPCWIRPTRSRWTKVERWGRGPWLLILHPASGSRFYLGVENPYNAAKFYLFFSSINVAKQIQAIRGMNDCLPEQSPVWQKVEQILRQVVASYGYSEVRTCPSSSRPICSSVPSVK
jgi:hypothetical protein